MRKDKEKIVDEVWTEARIREFLDVLPPEGTDPDFHMLLKAYQQMRAEDFATFLGMFKEAGRDINARGPEGETVLSIVERHRYGGEFVEALREAGAG